MKQARYRTENEFKEIKELTGSQIESIKEEIIELSELTKPVSLDASIGRLSRMDAINNKANNEKALREKKSTLQSLLASERDMKTRINLASA